MRRQILGITYLSAHRALGGITNIYCDLFRQRGYQVDTFNLAQPDAYQKLDLLLHRDKISFCFAPQGVGSRLGNDKHTIWEQRQIPFIGVHGDSPYYNIFNHFSTTRYVANLYLYESLLDVFNRYIQTDQVADLTPFQVYYNGPSPIRFRERPIKILYLKAGESIEECVQILNTLAAPLRDAVWQQLERTHRDPNLQVCDLVQEIFTQFNVDRTEQFDLFWGCCHWMDMYLRRRRAADFVDWLKMQEGALIVGDGWDFIDRSNARAVFRPSLDIESCLQLYYESQFICNTSPYGRDILHERAGIGLMNGSLVIGDTNAWWDKHFSAVPAYKRFSWGDSLDDQLKPALDLSLDEAENQAATGCAPAEALFSGKDLVAKVLACVAKIDQSCLP